MSRPPETVRMPTHARLVLAEVVQRTQRPISQFLQDSIADLSTAFVTDPGVIARFNVTRNTDRGPMPRTTVVYSDSTAQILHALCEATGIATNAIARAAWVRWISLRDVGDIVGSYGAVRPAVTHVPASEGAA